MTTGNGGATVLLFDADGAAGAGEAVGVGVIENTAASAVTSENLTAEGADVMSVDAKRTSITRDMGVADTLTGIAGHDTIPGGDGNDVLDGGSSKDALVGSTSSDLLTGGDGADVFVFGAKAGKDRITDFVVGTDSLVFETGVSITGVRNKDVDGDGRMDSILSLSHGGQVTLLGVAEYTPNDTVA